ncbi:TetR/AcrR family transcriptional regulator [Solimonas marina]|uniref:TetR/AcrR family transcriptional regulator n=1 Tax=Solimonas marina TaxID=2714601 RepID=A0A970B4X1_9GAMM|nr:TetR/AcrR family transcriptional regulator [Solimonas marina]NKF21083.1 TetR/AcrR family transcriptional regulator [Solimonas marina]
MLDAARSLVIEHGYEAVSTQMIADTAGVARQTLYRRWPGKAELVLDAFLQSVMQDEAVGDQPFEEELRRFLQHLFRNLRRDGGAIRSLIASAQRDAAFLETFRTRFALRRAEIVKAILRRAVASGELPAEADIETATTMFHGAFWYRLLLGQPLDDVFIERLLRLLCAGLRAEPETLQR